VLSCSWCCGRRGRCSGLFWEFPFQLFLLTLLLFFLLSFSL